MKPYRISSSLCRVMIICNALLLAPACSEPVTRAEPGEENIVDATSVQTSVKQDTAAVAVTAQANSGVVKAVQTAGAYSYLKVDSGTEQLWLATMASSVQPGQKIRWRDYALMRNFKSKALGREFEQILFVDRIFTETAGAEAIRRGIVEESMDAAGYSYIRVDHDGRSIWLAAPATRVEVGQHISWSGGAPMRNFTSGSLNRKFEEILFVAAVNRS